MHHQREISCRKHAHTICHIDRFCLQITGKQFVSKLYSAPRSIHSLFMLVDPSNRGRGAESVSGLPVENQDTQIVRNITRKCLFINASWFFFILCSFWIVLATDNRSISFAGRMHIDLMTITLYQYHWIEQDKHRDGPMGAERWSS